MKSSERLIVALDFPSLPEAEAIVRKLSPAVRFFKIGMELFASEGPVAVRRVVETGSRVFLDLKFHDIPNTVASSCRAAAGLGVALLNVHASGGKRMLEDAAAAVRGSKAKLLAVTVLTSLSDEDLGDIGVGRRVEDQVAALARLAKACGLAGAVASPGEIEIIRKAAGADFLIVTPGVRPVWAERGDQKRVLTPREAVEKGADFIVVGRPITQAKDPLEAARKILDEIRS